MENEIEDNDETNTWGFMFGIRGFESIVNLTEIDEAYVFAKLSEEKLPQSVGSVINFLTLRARFNPERDLQVWMLGVEKSIAYDDLNEWADREPQGLADLIRERGTVIYGANNTKSDIKII